MIVTEGTPEKVAQHPESHTDTLSKKELSPNNQTPRKMKNAEQNPAWSLFKIMENLSWF